MTDAKNEAARAARKANKPKRLLAYDVLPKLAARLKAPPEGRGPDDCWIWPGRTDRKGYGVLTGTVNNKSVCQKVHRASFALANGEVPVGLVVRHSCDTPACWNPRHLRAGTHADNVRDMFGRNRDQWSRENPSPRTRPRINERKAVLSPDGASWPNAAECARAMGVDRSTVVQWCRSQWRGWKYAIA